MRLNRYIALCTGLSRRAADDAVYRNRVLVNGRSPSAGQQIQHTDTVSLDGSLITLPADTMIIMLSKPRGYVCSRDGQGSKTIYDLLPEDLHMLKAVGRLDKDSEGLLLMTNDGALAQQLTHPRYKKLKVYEVILDKPLEPLHRRMIKGSGISLEDGISRLRLERLQDGNEMNWLVSMHEGRNRQIRRTFEALGYTVTHLKRTRFGDYALAALKTGEYINIKE